MRYVVDELRDGVVVHQFTIEHPALDLKVPWFLNGVPQGVTTVGPKGFVLTTDRRHCLIFAPAITGADG